MPSRTTIGWLCCSCAILASMKKALHVVRCAFEVILGGSMLLLCIVHTPHHKSHNIIPEDQVEYVSAAKAYGLVSVMIAALFVENDSFMLLR